MKRVAGVTAALMLAMQMRVVGYGAVTNNASAWAVPHIQKAEALGLVQNDLLQDAKAAITRQEFCHMMIQFYEKVTGKTAEPAAENPFADCADEDVLAAYGLGIVSGIEPNYFYPQRTLTREQMAIMMVRTLEVCGVDMLSYAKYNPFTDTKTLNKNAIKHINKAYGAGLISGYDAKTFAPKKALSVQEAVATFVSSYQFYETTKQSIPSAQKAEQPKQEALKPQQPKTEEPKAEQPKAEQPKAEQPKQEEPKSQKQEIPQATATNEIRLGDKTIVMGQTTEQIKATFGEPTRIDKNMEGKERYVYANDWKQYFFVTFENDMAVELFTPTENFVCQDAKGGMQLEQLSDNYRLSSIDNFANMENDDVVVKLPVDHQNVVRGLLVQTKAYAKTEHFTESLDSATQAYLQAEAKDLVQAIRAKEGVPLLVSHEKMDLVATAHSEDMAKNNYFAYNSQNGTTPFQRMQAERLQFHTATEVIVKHRGEIPQLYTALLRVPAKQNTVADSHMTQMGVGIGNQGKTVYLTIDLSN